MIRDLPGEEWKAVEGFPDYYISNKGRLKSYKQRGKILKPTLAKDQYPWVTLFRDAAGFKAIYIARLVLEHFYGPAPSPNHVAHPLDLNPMNCVLENLVWVSKSQVCGRKKKSPKEQIVQEILQPQV